MNKSIKEAVSAIFTHVESNEVFFIKRQNYLKAFPGYTSFPGGKVDKQDFNSKDPQQTFMPQNLFNALVREMQEELHIDLNDWLAKGIITSIDLLGAALTPDFNPYRFKSYFYKITLSQKVDIHADSDEASWSGWANPQLVYKDYLDQKILAVPPMVSLLKILDQNIHCVDENSIDLIYDSATEIAMIESIHGIRHFLPLSNTFPPANRTNSFIIGDDFKVLIDPSPKDEQELEKFYKSIEKVGFEAVMLTHHHPDHHEFAPQICRKYNVDIYMSADTQSRILNKWGKDYFENIKIHLLKESDVLTKSMGKDVLVFAVPGHDEGQLALAPASMEWFLVGDLIQTIGTVVVGGDEGDMSKYYASLEKVIALKPAIIIPSHGISVGGVHRLEQTLEHRKMREAQVRELSEKNYSEDQMLAEIYKGLEDYLKPYALENIRKHLEKIQKDKA